MLLLLRPTQRARLHYDEKDQQGEAILIGRVAITIDSDEPEQPTIDRSHLYTAEHSGREGNRSCLLRTSFVTSHNH